MVFKKDIQIAAYFHWLKYFNFYSQFGQKYNPYTELDHWLYGENLIIRRWRYKQIDKEYWDEIEKIRQDKEKIGYIGDMTVGGRPPVCGIETAGLHKQISQKWENIIPEIR